jgi:hypothetical protein
MVQDHNRKDKNMNKIAFEHFEQIMNYDVSNNQHSQEIEIWFCIDNSTDYYSSWLGKMLDNETKKEIYWYGLVEDGTQAYDFDSFEQFINAKVFNDKNIKDIWDSVSLLSIDACDIQERLPFYLGS